MTNRTRDAAILARFNGRNLYELASEFGLTVHHVYLALRRARGEPKPPTIH